MQITENITIQAKHDKFEKQEELDMREMCQNILNG